jgi:putative sulfotransferase
MPDRGAFVISAGRCGSTMLSDLLATHPSVLAIQELMHSVQPSGLGTGTCTGAQFWRVLSGPAELAATLKRIGLSLPQFRYRGARRVPGDPYAVPRVLATTLPALTNDPDRLFDELSDEVPRFPEQPIPAHYHTLFGLLAERIGRPRWIERSGGSSVFAASLVRMFPDARYVYLTRDPFDAAVSMSKHPGFLLLEVRSMFVRRCGVDPYQAGAGPFRRPVPDDLQPVLPDAVTPASLTARGGDLRNFILMWAYMCRLAEAALALVPADRVLRMRYEDLLNDPANELARLAAALDLPDGPAWAARAAGRVIRQGPGLPPGDPRRAELRELVERVAPALSRQS